MSMEYPVFPRGVVRLRSCRKERHLINNMSEEPGGERERGNE